jgi:chromosome partitioning protein
MKTTAIANQKGGCGKTTTAVNLAAAMAVSGRRVLLIDLDAQGHSTLGYGHTPNELELSVYDALTKPQVPLERVILKTAMPNVDLCPSNVLLSGGEFEMAPIYGREYVLSQKLKYVEDRYDICVIDCSPSLSVLTLNALVASVNVVIPVQVHYYAMEGLKQLLETIEIVKERFNPHLSVAGILLTFLDNTKLSRQVQEQMREFFGDLVLKTVIHRNVRLAEAPSAGEPVLTYAPESSGAVEYTALAQELYDETKSRTRQESLVDL